MLKKLFEINTSLSQEMLTIMKAKIEERRNKQLVGLIHFLNKPDYVANKSYFSSCPKKQYLKYGEEILERLFTSAESSDIEMIDEENNYCHLINMSIEEELNDSLHTELMSHQSSSIVKKKRCHYQKEFQILESTGNRTSNLNLLFKTLLTMKPTSTESERVFSRAEIFITKIRNSLILL